MILITQQPDVEQTITVDIERNYQVCLFGFDVLNVLDGERPGLVVHVNGLQGFSILIQLDACKQGGMSLESFFYRFKQPLTVK